MPTLRRSNSKKNFNVKNHAAVLAGKKAIYKMEKGRLQSGKKLLFTKWQKTAYKAVKFTKKKGMQ